MVRKQRRLSRVLPRQRQKRLFARPNRLRSILAAKGQLGETGLEADLRWFPELSGLRCVFRSDSGSLAVELPLSETTRWRAVVRVLRSPTDGILDAFGCALLPASCSLCGASLPRLSSVPICDLCWDQMPALNSAGGCARCGDTVDAAAEAGLCRACRLAPPPFARAVAYGLYRGRLKDAIHALKYERLHPAARVLGRMLAAAIAPLAAEAPDGLVVVPVPLHRSKHAQRGFNQARALAREAVACLRKAHPEWPLTLEADALQRVRATESQAGLTPRQRRLNVRAAFRVHPTGGVAEKNVLVIDDIMTTGATARAAALAIRRAGAKNVWVATLARARRGGFAARTLAQDREDFETVPAAMVEASKSQPQGSSALGEARGWFS